MIVHLNLPIRQKRRFEKLLRELLVPTSSEEEADLVFSNVPHPFKYTVIVGKLEDNVKDTVIDVINPGIDKDVLKLKLKLYEVYTQTGDYMEIVDEEFSKARRNTMPLSVVIFKVMDEDLEAIRSLIVSMSLFSRRSDKFFNLGEGEILVLLPGTDKEGAELFVRRLNRRFVREYLKKRIVKKPSYAYGIAEMENWMVLGEDLLSAAEYDLLKKLR
jgi:hypothetical protein